MLTPLVLALVAPLCFGYFFSIYFIILLASSCCFFFKKRTHPRNDLVLLAGQELDSSDYVGAKRVFLLDIDPKAVKGATSIIFPNGEKYV